MQQQGYKEGAAQGLASARADAGGPCGEQPASCSAGEPCSVCMATFKETEMVVELPCCHCFHEECLMPWLQEVGMHVHFSQRCLVSFLNLGCCR